MSRHFQHGSGFRAHRTHYKRPCTEQQQHQQWQSQMSSTSPRRSLHQIGPFQNGGKRRVNCRFTSILELFLVCTGLSTFKYVYLCYAHRGTKRSMRKFVVLEYHRNCSVTSADLQWGGELLGESYRVQIFYSCINVTLTAKTQYRNK